MMSAPRAIIDHAALRHNLAQVRRAAPASRVWAVVKADAYGHGAAPVARSLSADGLAVARLDEALALRRAGEARPLLVMGGVYSVQEWDAAMAARCEPVLHHGEQVRQAARRPSDCRVWLKVNTGMNRLGMAPPEAGARLRELHPTQPLGLMTHLADADDLADPMTDRQCAVLRSVAGAARHPLSIGNSAGILGWPAARSDWVRPGIMLYGVSPFLNEVGSDRDLLPVMTLRAPLIAVNPCRRGDRVGYGGTYVCPQDMPVGVVGIGYGDGYPRHAPGGTPVSIGGRRVPLVGRVSMDMVTVDLRGLPDARVGDLAVLWGRELPVEQIAAAAGTIAYELLTGVTARVVREHLHAAG